MTGRGAGKIHPYGASSVEVHPLYDMVRMSDVGIQRPDYLYTYVILVDSFEICN